MLVTLEQAKDHLRVDFDDIDNDILFKIKQASALCLTYLKLPLDSYQDSSGGPQDVPFYLSAATLIWLGLLFKFRDNDVHSGSSFGYVPPEIVSILYPYRTPTFR